MKYKLCHWHFISQSFIHLILFIVFCNVSILFTTASQPVLTGRIEGTNPNASFDALNSVHEIIPKDASCMKTASCGIGIFKTGQMPMTR